jgi:hypothetical protein
VREGTVESIESAGDEVRSRNGVHVHIQTSDNAVVYLLPDLEGDVESVFSWFLAMGLIAYVGRGASDTRLVWTGKDVWVIQLGDQIDSSRWVRGRVRVRLG